MKETAIQKATVVSGSQEHGGKPFFSGEYQNYYEKCTETDKGGGMSVMKVLVTGVAGQLGHDVMQELAKREIPAVGTDLKEGIPLDITDERQYIRCCRKETNGNPSWRSLDSGGSGRRGTKQKKRCTQ